MDNALDCAGVLAVGTSDSLMLLVRYATDGTPQFIRFPLAIEPSDAWVDSLPDGGAVTTDIEIINGDVAACQLRRFDATGEQLWSVATNWPSDSQLGAACANPRIDGQGELWVFDSGGVELLDSRGGQAAWFSFDSLNANAVAADPMQPAIYVAGITVPSSTDATDSVPVIGKLTAAGLQWMCPAPIADADAMLDDVVVGQDGSLWAFGAQQQQLYGLHVGSDGSYLWSGTVTTTVNAALVKVAARADGGVSTVHWDTFAWQSGSASGVPEVSSFTAAGDRQWHQSSGFTLPTSNSVPDIAIATMPNNEVAVAMNTQTGFDVSTGDYALTFEQERWNTAGSLLFSRQLQPSVPAFGPLQLAALADNTTLGVASGFYRFDASGRPQSTPQTQAITTATSLDLTEALGPDGSAYLVATNSDVRSFGVTAYEPDGAMRWHTAEASAWTNQGLTSATLSLRVGDVCLTGQLDGNEIVRCYGLADGKQTAALEFANGLSVYQFWTQALATTTGELVILYQTSDGALHHALIDTHGQLMHDIEPLQATEQFLNASQNTNGESIVVTTNGIAIKIAMDGSRVFAVTSGPSMTYATLSPDGTTILQDGLTPPTLERIDANGSTLWRSTMPNTGGYSRALSMRFTSDALYAVLSYNYAFGYPTLNSLVVKLALSDGHLEWGTPIPYIFGQRPALVLDSANDVAFTFNSWGDRTRWTRLRLADGVMIGSRYEPCGVDQCFFWQAVLASDGTLRTVQDTTDLHSGSAWQLSTLPNDVDSIFQTGFE